MQEQLQQDPVRMLLAEFGTRLNEVEEKQRLVRDRALLIGQNLVDTKESYEKEIFEIKKQVNLANYEIKNLKQLSQRIIDELENLARKTELEILEKQMKIFQPIEFARIKDVKNMISEALKEQATKK